MNYLAMGKKATKSVPFAHRSSSPGRKVRDRFEGGIYDIATKDKSKKHSYMNSDNLNPTAAKKGASGNTSTWGDAKLNRLDEAGSIYDQGKQQGRKHSCLEEKHLHITAAKKGASGKADLWGDSSRDRFKGVGSIYDQGDSRSKKHSFLQSKHMDICAAKKGASGNTSTWGDAKLNRLDEAGSIYDQGKRNNTKLSYSGAESSFSGHGKGSGVAMPQKSAADGSPRDRFRESSRGTKGSEAPKKHVYDATHKTIAQAMSPRGNGCTFGG